MLSKLSLRNAKRSMKDYLVYMITMVVVAALMFGFNTMLFSKDVQNICTEFALLAIMLGLATFFIIVIIAWLINYMIRFMMEKRSKEFGTYLLLGMKKREISKVYFRENVILGAVAFVFGILLGGILSQILMSIFYSLMGNAYHVKITVSPLAVLVTLTCYSVCFLLALFRSRKKFKKMNIANLMKADKENQKLEYKGTVWKQWLFPLSIVYFVLFYVYVFSGKYSLLGFMVLIIGYVAAIYLIYIGLSAVLVRYLKGKGNMMYKGTNIFLLRQLSSKIKTMQFTMGTLSVLFSVALFGCTFAMMFHDYQKKQLPVQFPFDVLVHSEDVKDTFEDEITIINKNNEIKHQLVYQIYENGTTKFNDYLYNHLSYFGGKYKDQEGIEGDAYFKYDTYMKLSDYNSLREMIGLKSITLQKDEYLIHTKENLITELGSSAFDKEVVIDGKSFHMAGYSTEKFALDGHNGADYIIVVPDKAIDTMSPLYSELAVEIAGKTDENLYQELLDNRKNRILAEGDLNIRKSDIADEEEDYEEDYDDDYYVDLPYGYGTDQIMVYISSILVKDYVIKDMRYLTTAVMLPLIYMGLVFLCVALTILSVQQLSDSTRYKFRYGVLSKLGLNKRQINACVFRQLLIYYLCPILIAVVMSCGVAIFASSRFIYYTGVKTSVFLYYGISLLVFVGCYLIYFIATYIGFKRNIQTY